MRIKRAKTKSDNITLSLKMLMKLVQLCVKLPKSIFVNILKLKVKFQNYRVAHTIRVEVQFAKTLVN